MSAPNSQESILVEKLRSSTTDLKLENDSDMFFVRWIRAREGNLIKAEEMLRKHVEYVEESNFYSLRTWEPPSDFVEKFPVEIVGFDEDNCPIAVIHYGKWDIKKCYEMGLREEYMSYLGKYFLDTMDKMKGKLRSDGVPVTQFVLVLDMDELSMRFLTSFGAMDITMETLRLFEMNHPETLKKCYVVNASRIFTLLFKVVRPLLSQHTFGKVDIFDCNVSKFSPHLQEIIPLELLPAKLGGQNYSSILNPGQVPENMRKVKVPPGGNHIISLEVNDSDRVLSWSFLTSNHDIGFSLSCENEELVKYARVDAKTRTQHGSIICHRPGTYNILFDNSYSTWRAKEIQFSVQLESA